MLRAFRTRQEPAQQLLAAFGLFEMHNVIRLRNSLYTRQASGDALWRTSLGLSQECAPERISPA